MIKSILETLTFKLLFFFRVFCTLTWWRCAREGEIDMPLSLKLIMGTPGNSRVGMFILWTSQCGVHNLFNLIFQNFSSLLFPRAFGPPPLFKLQSPHLYILNIYFPLTAAFLLPVSYFCLSSSCQIS